MLKKQVWKIVDARLILSFKPPAWVLKFDVSFKSGVCLAIIQETCRCKTKNKKSRRQPWVKRNGWTSTQNSEQRNQGVWMSASPADLWLRGWEDIWLSGWLLGEEKGGRNAIFSWYHCRHQRSYHLRTRDCMKEARILEWIAFPSPADLPDLGIKPRSPGLQPDSLLSRLPM